MARGQRKRRRTNIRSIKNVEVVKMYGREPDWSSFDASPDSKEFRMEYSRALNWGSAAFDNDKRKEMFLNYAKENKPDVNGLRSLPSWRFQGVGVPAWLIMSGCSIPEDSMRYFTEKCDTLFDMAKDFKKENDDEIPTATRASVAQRELEKRNLVLEEMDCLLYEDSMWAEKKKDAKLANDKDLPYKILQEHKPTQAATSYISDHFKGILDELNDIKSDPDLKEGYAGMSKTDITNEKKWLQLIIDQCQSYIANAKSARKPRKRKVLSISKKVQKVKYMEESKEYKLKSIDPSAIVGASALLVFNTKSRKIGIYKAKKGNYLDIKGTTLQNWDVETSQQKTLRKPDEQIPAFRGTRAIRRCETLLKNIRAKVFKMNGRINGDMIIMKAYT